MPAVTLCEILSQSFNGVTDFAFELTACETNQLVSLCDALLANPNLKTLKFGVSQYFSFY